MDSEKVITGYELGQSAADAGWGEGEMFWDRVMHPLSWFETDEGKTWTYKDAMNTAVDWCRQQRVTPGEMDIDWDNIPVYATIDISGYKSTVRWAGKNVGPQACVVETEGCETAYYWAMKSPTENTPHEGWTEAWYDKWIRDHNEDRRRWNREYWSKQK